MKNLNRFLATFLSFIIFSSCASVDSGDTFLWRVESETNHIYLLGSIPVGTNSLYPLDFKIMTAYDDSRSVAFDVKTMTEDPEELHKHDYYTDGTVLKDKISFETYEKLRMVFEKYSVNEGAYREMKPWAALSLAKKLIINSDNSFFIGQSIKDYFVLQATTDSKEIKELESIKNQIELFDEYSEMTDSYLMYEIENLKKMIEDPNKIVKPWKKGETESLLDILNDAKSEYPDLDNSYSDFIERRNDKILDTLDVWLASNRPIFVVVDIEHLLGENSLIRRLDESGKYSIDNY